MQIFETKASIIEVTSIKSVKPITEEACALDVKPNNNNEQEVPTTEPEKQVPSSLPERMEEDLVDSSGEEDSDEELLEADDTYKDMEAGAVD